MKGEQTWSVWYDKRRIYLPSANVESRWPVEPRIKFQKPKIDIEYNRVKNPNWQKAIQLEKQFQLMVYGRLDPATSAFQVGVPNHSVTRTFVI